MDQEGKGVHRRFRPSFAMIEMGEDASSTEGDSLTVPHDENVPLTPLEGSTSGSGSGGDALARDGPLVRTVPVRVKALFCFIELARLVMFISQTVYLAKFYTDVVELPLGTLAVTMALAKSADAVVFPIIGWYSDMASTRWGRRLPFIAIGAPLCSLFYFALFAPPPSMGNTASAHWFGLTFFFHAFFYIILQIPLTALWPEVTFGCKDRPEFYAWLQVSNAAALLLAAGVPSTLAKAIGDRAGYAVVSGVTGLVLLISSLLLVTQLEENPPLKTPQPPIITSIRWCFRNSVFVHYLGVYFLIVVAGALVTGMMPYYNEYVVRPKDPDSALSLVLGVYVCASLLGLPIWVRVARRIGKKKTISIAFAAIGAGCCTGLFLPEGGLFLFCLLAAFVGFTGGIANVFVNALIADLIDYDMLLCGKRREAMYNAISIFVERLSVVPATAFPVAVLASLGYEANEDQTNQVKTAIRVLFGLGPAVFCVLGLYVVATYPMTDKKHVAVIKNIVLQEGHMEAYDPLKGHVLPPWPANEEEEHIRWFFDHFSLSELRLLRGGDTSVLLRHVKAKIAWWSCLLVCAAVMTILVLTVIPVPEPSNFAVATILVCSVAATFILFHSLRLDPARRMTTVPYPAKAVHDAIAENERLLQ